MKRRSYHLAGLGAGLPQIKRNIPADCGLEMTTANVVICVFQSVAAPQDRTYTPSLSAYEGMY